MTENNLKRWPKPTYDRNDEPHFLFILTLPYSGSTALSELINTSHKTMILHPKGEGQWLVPGLCEDDRWDHSKCVDYGSVKSVWLAQYQHINRLTQNIEIVIEKSPPNIARFETLASHFKRYTVIANNRNPYASCASRLYRRHNIDILTQAQREKILTGFSEDWVARSDALRALILKHNITLITYEQFCATPDEIIAVLPLTKAIISTINPDATVIVKDYQPQKIANQNTRQIANLSKRDIQTLNKTFKPKRDLLSYFGYSVQ